jgi:hypothetical protein
MSRQRHSGRMARPTRLLRGVTSPLGMPRWLIAAVAPVCIAAQLIVFAHMLLVRHSTCPEHGELIHGEADAHASQGHAAKAALAELVRPATEIAARVVFPAAEDSHCDVVGHRREFVQPAVFEAVGPELGVIGLALFGPASAPLHDGSRRYSLAPKTSPPSGTASSDA